MTAILRTLVLLGACMVALNPQLGAMASEAQSLAEPSLGRPPAELASTTSPPMLRDAQYVAPAPGYPPGQYYAPGQGYPGNYAPVPPPPQYYAPPYYERRFYPPPVYVQPYYSNRFCARYPWRCG